MIFVETTQLLVSLKLQSSKVKNATLGLSLNTNPIVDIDNLKLGLVFCLFFFLQGKNTSQGLKNGLLADSQLPV